MSKLPVRSRIYQNHHFDSTRWDYFEPRSTDIIVATSYKAGDYLDAGYCSALAFSGWQFSRAAD